MEEFTFYEEGDEEYDAENYNLENSLWLGINSSRKICSSSRDNINDSKNVNSRDNNISNSNRSPFVVDHLQYRKNNFINAIIDSGANVHGTTKRL
jgi:hypothetical protein